jgi:hypothetical protein
MFALQVVTKKKSLGSSKVHEDGNISLTSTMFKIIGIVR